MVAPPLSTTRRSPAVFALRATLPRKPPRMAALAPCTLSIVRNGIDLIEIDGLDLSKRPPGRRRIVVVVLDVRRIHAPRERPLGRVALAIQSQIAPVEARRRHPRRSGIDHLRRIDGRIPRRGLIEGPM